MNNRSHNLSKQLHDMVHQFLVLSLISYDIYPKDHYSKSFTGLTAQEFDNIHDRDNKKICQT